MHLIWRRYNRSGFAPAWFYVALVVGFTALAVVGAVRGDWLVLPIALVMAGVTVLVSVVARRLGDPRARNGHEERGKDNV
jgi:hypothetical protein